MTPASYGPTISEFRHVAFSSVEETTYFMVSFMKGAPGSSACVRADHAGSNISYVVRPSRIPWQPAMAPPSAAPILGSKPYSKVHVGSLITPSRVMNSCTLMLPMMSASWRVTRGQPLWPPCCLSHERAAPESTPGPDSPGADEPDGTSPAGGKPARESAT